MSLSFHAQTRPPIFQFTDGVTTFPAKLDTSFELKSGSWQAWELGPAGCGLVNYGKTSATGEISEKGCASGSSS